jgi:hypothetical protein
VGDYTFGSQMGGSDDPMSDSLGSLLTYGADSDEETTGQPGGAPNVKSDASAPNAPAAHVQAVAAPQASPPTQSSGVPTYSGPDPDELEALQQQKVTDQAPNRVSPKWWERLGGGLAAGAMAFGKVPGAVEVGSGITNRGQINADNDSAAKVAQDDTAIQAWRDGQRDSQQQFADANTTFENNDRAQSRAQMNQDRAAQETQRLGGVAPGSEAPDDPKNPLGPWHATSVGGKPVALQGPPASWAKSPAGVAAQRDADVDRLKLTGDDAKYYRANGKLKEPNPVTNIRVPSEGQEAYGDARAAWKAANPGKTPTLSDLRDIRAAADGKADAGPKRGTPGQFASLDKETAAQYAKAEAEYKAAADSNATDADKASALANLNAEKARIGADHSQRLRDLGGVPAEDSPSSKGTAAQMPKAPQPNTPLTDKAIAKQYLDAAGGNKDKARAAAKLNNWQF